MDQSNFIQAAAGGYSLELLNLYQTDRPTFRKLTEQANQDGRGVIGLYLAAVENDIKGDMGSSMSNQRRKIRLDVVEALLNCGARCDVGPVGTKERQVLVPFLRYVGEHENLHSYQENLRELDLVRRMIERGALSDQSVITFLGSWSDNKPHREHLCNKILHMENNVLSDELIAMGLLDPLIDDLLLKKQHGEFDFDEFLNFEAFQVYDFQGVGIYFHRYGKYLLLRRMIEVDKMPSATHEQWCKIFPICLTDDGALIEKASLYGFDPEQETPQTNVFLNIVKNIRQFQMTSIEFLIEYVKACPHVFSDPKGEVWQHIHDLKTILTNEDEGRHFLIFRHKDGQKSTDHCFLDPEEKIKLFDEFMAHAQRAMIEAQIDERGHDKRAHRLM